MKKYIYLCIDVCKSVYKRLYIKIGLSYIQVLKPDCCIIVSLLHAKIWGARNPSAEGYIIKTAYNVTALT